MLSSTIDLKLAKKLRKTLRPLYLKDPSDKEVALMSTAICKISKRSRRVPKPARPKVPPRSSACTFLRVEGGGRSQPRPPIALLSRTLLRHKLSKMPAIFDNCLAFVAGIGVSCFFIAVLEMLGHRMFPIPANVNYKDKEQLRSVIKNLPLGAFLMVELAYVVGSLAGGYVIARFASTRQAELACGLGALLTLFGFQNLLAIPHPRWFAILSTLTYIPLTYVGAKAHLELM